MSRWISEGWSRYTIPMRTRQWRSGRNYLSLIFTELCMRMLPSVALILVAFVNRIPAQSPPESVGVVSHIKVVSDKVPDVSSMDAWKKSFIREGMADEQKAMAAWRSTVMFQHQDTPPYEYLQNEQVVQDPIKIFNVYGYSFCSVASCDVAALARYAGLKA